MATSVEEDNYQRILRFTDVANESCKELMPIRGFEDEPLVSLEEAVQPLIPLLVGIQNYAHEAKERCRKPPADGLTVDESASIMLYTMSWKPIEQCFYFVLNDTLRSGDRDKLKPWFRYLKLFLTALSCLPSIARHVYRGVKEDFSAKYQKNTTPVAWWGFSSCTDSIGVLESKMFLGKTGARTIFTIDCDSGREIRNHSRYPSENEILLVAAREFKVISSLNPADDLYMIQLQEVESSDPPLIQFPLKVKSDQNLSLKDKIQQCEKNSLINLEKQQLTDADMNIVVKQAIIRKQCRQLRLGGNAITSAGALILSEALRNNNTLEELELQHNSLSNQGVLPLSNILSINSNTLKTLVLGNNKIGDEGAKSLAKMLQSNSTLNFLGLAGNEIAHEGLQSLADAIVNYNRTLQCLVLSGNKSIDDESDSSLLRLTKQGQFLKYLDVNSCSLSRTVKTQLSHAGYARSGFRIET
jgi:hypothetical protein